MSTPGSGRRTPPRGSRPAGRGGPGRTHRPARSRASLPVAGRRTTEQQRPRLTSRAAVLVLIVAVLAVSYASSMRAYLQQRDHLAAEQARISASETNIASMEDEIARQQTWPFIEQQARGIGMVYPGEKSFVVLDGGDPLDVESTLGDPSVVDPAEPVAWWDDAWTTVKVAGNPPRRTDPPPQTKITDPVGAPTDSDPQEDGE